MDSQNPASFEYPHAYIRLVQGLTDLTPWYFLEKARMLKCATDDHARRRPDRAEVGSAGRAHRRARAHVPGRGSPRRDPRRRDRVEREGRAPSGVRSGRCHRGPERPRRRVCATVFFPYAIEGGTLTTRPPFAVAGAKFAFGVTK